MAQIVRPLSMTLAAVAAAAMLAACDRRDVTAAEQRADTTVAQAEQRAEQRADEVKAETREAGRDVREAARDAKDATVSAAETAGDKVKDAAITASVKSKLAADASLSALAIDVDTSNGRVALHGTAPDTAAKERASQLASSVDGVVSVDNGLTVR